MPTFGVGLMFLLVSLYMMKFATDALLLSPAAMGTIFFISRVWDAISDPVAGFLSDRTTSPLGRRRPWLLAAAPLVALAFFLMWSPPSDLSASATTLWMAVAVIGFYTAMTVFIVPHQSLGAELTSDYHGRSRVFAWRHIIWSLGSIVAVVLMQLMINAASPRAAAHTMAIAVAACTGLLILWAVVRLRERSEYQGRGASNPLSAYGDVWRNRHARLLLAVFLIESLGGATIAILTPYVAEYIVGRPDLTAVFIAFYMAPNVLSTPIWPPLARRFGKKNLWLASMVVTGLAFGGMFFISEGAIVLISVLAAIAGTANGCGSIMSPSIQSDIIDYDEFETGQRKEGSYFAAWNFTFKSATGVTLMLTGLVLEWSGFTPNVEQTPLARSSILGLYSLFPFVCYGIGALLFARFSLDEAEHQRIQAALDLRASAQDESTPT